MNNRNDLPPTAAAAGVHHDTIFIATELSGKSWLLAVHTPLQDKISLYNFAAHDAAAIVDKVLRIKGDVEAKLGRPVKVMSVFEAGRDGFWYHRQLVAAGIDSLVINPVSLEVDRRAKRAKTDSIDVHGLLRALMAFARGEEQVFSAVCVPSVEQEDLRRLGRERQRLISERTGHINRLEGLLATQGVYGFRPLRGDRHEQLDAFALPQYLRGELRRELQRLDLVQEQIRAVEAERAQFAKNASATDRTARHIGLLSRFKGIATEFSSLLAIELYDRVFDNRRKLTGFVGLCSSPYNSGGMERDQGISKAGPPRIRQAAIELAWSWTLHQPDSALTKWFKARVGDMKGRIKRISIVALARKLLIALWRYLHDGVIPEGAVLKS